MACKKGHQLNNLLGLMYVYNNVYYFCLFGEQFTVLCMDLKLAPPSYAQKKLSATATDCVKALHSCPFLSVEYCTKYTIFYWSTCLF